MNELSHRRLYTKEERSIFETIYNRNSDLMHPTLSGQNDLHLILIPERKLILIARAFAHLQCRTLRVTVNLAIFSTPQVRRTQDFQLLSF